MSDLSQSSQNCQQIIANFFNYRKQWAQVPQVVYLTIKAMHRQNQNIEQHIYQQKQLVAQQSVKIKQLAIQIEELARQRMNHFTQISQFQQSGFKKSKKGQKFVHSKPQSSRRARFNQNTFDVRQQRSISFQNSLSNTMIEEVKALAQAILQNKLSQLHFSQQQLNNRISEKQQKLTKDMQSFRQQIFQTLSSKTRQLQLQFNKKIQIQRTNVMKFIEQSSIESQKLMIQINNIHLRLSELTKQEIDQKYTQVKNQKQNGKKNDQKQLETNTQYKKLNENITNMNKQYIQFKLKINKQLTFYMKAEAIQRIVTKLQNQITQKVNKLNKTITQISAEINNLKRTTITKNQSKAILQSYNSLQQQQRANFKKQKGAQKSLVVIQQTLEKLQNHFKQKLKTVKKQLNSHVQITLQRDISHLKNEIRQELDKRQKVICEIVQVNCNNFAKNSDRSFSFNDNSLKNAVEKLSQQMILTRLLHLGQRNSKQVIQWEKNVYNSMQQNFVWKNNSHMITVMAAGLYRLEVGLYPDNQKDNLQASVMLNGVPISNLKNKQVPINIVAPSRGSLFNEAVLLPGKSKIWVKTDLPFFGQAYIQLLKL